jgi:hypothetical protein
MKPENSNGTIGLISHAAFKGAWDTLGEFLWALAMRVASPPMDSHQKGAAWEAEFRAMAGARGLAVEPGKGRADTRVAGLLVQCKAIDAAKTAAISIANMRKVAANDGYRGYLRSEVDVFALRRHGEIYLIPSAFLDRGDGRLKGSVRQPAIEEFKDAWHVFDEGYAPPASQTEFSFPEEAP